MRVAIGIGFLELMLGGIWYYLAHDMAASGNSSPESQRELGQMMGGAMGAVLGFAIFLSLVRLFKERKDKRETPDSENRSGSGRTEWGFPLPR
jgi:hypothetical protein